MRFKSYQEYRSAWDNSNKIDPEVPLNIDIELASVCNLRCPFCFIPDPSFESFISQKSSDGFPLRRIMSKQLAFKIIDECVEIGVPALKFNWRGESTLHPDYSEIVRYAKYVAGKWKISNHIAYLNGSEENNSYIEDRGFIELLANTNANCPPKSIDGLMATTKCMISLDSMVPETYRKMRVGGNLIRAQQVISELVDRGHKNVWVRRVLTKENYKEPFFQQVRNKWGEMVHISEHYCFDRNAKENLEVGCDHDDGLPRKYCQYPSQRLVISSAGYVYPCCIDLHETMPLGNIKNKSIMEIWNGDAVKNLRKTLRSNQKELMTKTCANCESWMAYDMPQRNFVKDTEVLANDNDE